MDWFDKIQGLSTGRSLNVLLPKEKVVDNIKRTFLRKAMTSELDNIEEIIYHMILRAKGNQSPLTELHVIEVVLFEPKYIKAIAEGFNDAIPYSKVIIFSSGEKYLLYQDLGDREKVYDWQFSDWVYEEELMADYFLGEERMLESNSAEANCMGTFDLADKLSELFSSAAYSEYICLRHLVDILKVREKRSGNDLVLPILSALIEKDKIEHFGEEPFAILGDADQLYNELSHHAFWAGHIEDERYGVDRKFELLNADDFTSISEAQELLTMAENTSIYLPYDDDKDFRAIYAGYKCCAVEFCDDESEEDGDYCDDE